MSLARTLATLIAVNAVAGCMVGDEPLVGSVDQASVIENGRFLNGRFLNGRFLNGRFLNGVNANGRFLNGQFLSAMNIAGVSVSGVSVDGTALMGTDPNGNIMHGLDFIDADMWGTAVVPQDTAAREDPPPPPPPDDPLLPSPDVDSGLVISSKLPDTKTALPSAHIDVGTDTAVEATELAVKLHIDDIVYLNGIYMHYVSYEAQDENGVWTNLPLCGLDGNGNPIHAVPRAFRWNFDYGSVGDGGKMAAAAGEFTWVCADGAIYKCEFVIGYDPSVDDAYNAVHQACVRLVTGDFCGKNISFTQNGQKVNIYDTIAVNADTEIWPMEADWTPAGAILVYLDPENVVEVGKGDAMAIEMNDERGMTLAEHQETGECTAAVGEEPEFDTNIKTAPATISFPALPALPPNCTDVACLFSEHDPMAQYQ